MSKMGYFPILADFGGINGSIITVGKIVDILDSFFLCWEIFQTLSIVHLECWDNAWYCNPVLCNSYGFKSFSRRCQSQNWHILEVKCKF